MAAAADKGLADLRDMVAAILREEPSFGLKRVCATLAERHGLKIVTNETAATAPLNVKMLLWLEFGAHIVFHAFHARARRCVRSWNIHSIRAS